MLRVNFDEIEVGDDLRYRYQGKPFTGEVVETLRDGRIVELATFRDGREDGPERAWYPDGRLKFDGQSRDGRAVGLNRHWHPNGQLAAERLFSERGELVYDKEWDEHGEPRHPDGSQG